MRVHVIGSAGTYPVPGRPGSGYLVERGGTRVWCDAGPGTFMALPVDPQLVDAVVISHQHPDHCSDLFAAFHAWTYGPEPRHGVPLFAPAAVLERLVGFVDRGQGSALTETFAFRPVWTGDRVAVGEMEISFAETDHSVPNVASRWEGDGKVFFFTGDTGPVGEWPALAREVDLMLSEAVYQGERAPDQYPHHLTAAEAGRIAREVGAKRLVLTHIPPHLDVSRSVHEAELVFDRPVGAAAPGMVLDV